MFTKSKMIVSHRRSRFIASAPMYSVRVLIHGLNPKPYTSTPISSEVGEGTGLGGAVGTDVGVSVGVGLGVSVGVGDGVSVGVGEGVFVGVGEGVSVGVGDGVAVGVAVGEGVGDGDGVAVGDEVGCVVGVAVGWVVADGAGVFVGATVFVVGGAVGVPEGEAPELFRSISSDTLPPTRPTATSPAIDRTKVRREIMCLFTGV